MRYIVFMMKRNVSLLVLLLFCIVMQVAMFRFSYMHHVNCKASKISSIRTRSILLRSSLNNKDDAYDMESIRGMKGYYRRPSRAIEKGGGFYVPGLEGEKIRVVSASVIFLLFAINRLGQQPSTVTTQQLISECMGVSVTILLFLQGLSTFLPQKSVKDALASQINTLSYISILQSNFDSCQSMQSKSVESIARSIIQTCVGTNRVIVISNSNTDPRVMIEMGPTSDKSLINSLNSNGVNKSWTRLISREANIDFSEVEPNSLNTNGSVPTVAGFVKDLSRTPLASLHPEKFSTNDKLIYCYDNFDSLWLVVTTSNDEEIMENKDWITSLVNIPSN